MPRKSNTPKVDGQCDYPGCPKRIDWSRYEKPPPGWAHVIMQRYGKDGNFNRATKLVCPEHSMDFAPRIGRLPDRTSYARVLIESPYGNSDPKEIEMNVQYLRAIMRECLLNGEAPFASHALYTQPGVLRDSIHTEREIGIQAGLEWGEAADKTVVYTDRGISDGMRVGIARADQQDRKVEFRKLKNWEKS